MMDEETKRELDRIWACQDKINSKLDMILEKLTENRVKVASIAAVLGFLGGAVPVVIAVVFKFWK